MGHRVSGKEMSVRIIKLCGWVAGSGFTTGPPSRQEELQLNVRRKKTERKQMKAGAKIRLS